jgi:hypothetical protein
MENSSSVPYQSPDSPRGSPSPSPSYILEVSPATKPRTEAKNTEDTRRSTDARPCAAPFPDTIRIPNNWPVRFLPSTATDRAESDGRGLASHLDLPSGHRVPLNNGRHKRIRVAEATAAPSALHQPRFPGWHLLPGRVPFRRGVPIRSHRGVPFESLTRHEIAGKLKYIHEK